MSPFPPHFQGVHVLPLQDLMLRENIKSGLFAYTLKYRVHTLEEIGGKDMDSSGASLSEVSEGLF